jgi:hypothetical protein
MDKSPAHQQLDTSTTIPRRRSTSTRRDTQETQRILINALAGFAAATGRPPSGLAEVAAAAGVSTATAYRHYYSLDDLASSYMAQVPEAAWRLYSASGRAGGNPDSDLMHWNQAWVKACLSYGASVVPLRSTSGFLERRNQGEPVISYVCSLVEPLLARCLVPIDLGLATWNAVSDPREVVDLRQTLGLSQRRIAEHITSVTLSLRKNS